eukprot:43132-Eustigmatos_ZCMA.PRE.1
MTLRLVIPSSHHRPTGCVVLQEVLLLGAAKQWRRECKFSLMRHLAPCEARHAFLRYVSRAALGVCTAASLRPSG